MGSDGVRLGPDGGRLGPMGSDWVISHTQLGDVKSVTGVSQFGDSNNLSTNDIFRPYISRMPTHRKIYYRK